MLSKALFAAFLCCFSALHLQAQTYSVSNKKAVKAFENAMQAFDARNTDLALSLLEDAVKREPDFVEAYLLKFEVLAESGRLEGAKGALEDALSIDPDFFPNAWFFLGTLQQRLGEYDGAIKSLDRFQKYRNVNPDMKANARAIASNAAFAMELMAHPVDFDPVNMGPAINTEMPEYYPCLTADGRVLLFTRLVNDPEAFKGKNEDFFVSRFENGEWQPSRPLSEINTKYNEGAPSISADGRVLVFTACEIMGDYGPGRKGFGSCDLFISFRRGSRWSNPENLGQPVNTRAWETQPSLSADGRTLYFIRGVQTREGVRDQDIYVTQRIAENEWTQPQRLSDKINTPRREESVMIHPDGRTLYFASEGHPGMGGMDLFVSQMDEAGEWQRPVNLGYPINTHNDENSLHIGPDGKIALFASDRSGGFGKLDLYAFELPEEVRPDPVTYAEGRVIDDLTEKAVEAELELYDLDRAGERMLFTSDPSDGSFLLALPTGRHYGLSVKADGYLYHSETFELKTAGGNQPYAIEVRLKKPVAGSAIVLRNVFFDTDKDVLKEESLQELAELAAFLDQNRDLNIEISGHTDNVGGADYNRDLSARRAEAVKSHLTSQYDVGKERIVTKGYGQEAPIATNETEEGRALNRRTEFKIL